MMLGRRRLRRDEQERPCQLSYRLERPLHTPCDSILLFWGGHDNMNGFELSSLFRVWRYYREFFKDSKHSVEASSGLINNG